MAGDRTMEDIWKRIAAWLAVNAPELLDSLKPGATEAEIQETESFLLVIGYLYF